MPIDDLHRIRLPRRGRRIAAALALLTLTQCTNLAPFEGPQPSADAHSICYNRAATNEAAVRRLAAAACNGGAPRLLAQGFDLSDCPLLVPMQLSFTCTS